MSKKSIYKEYKETGIAREKREAILELLKLSGITIAQLANEYGWDPATTSCVLYGKNRATIGKGHEVAVGLGLKEGFTNIKVNDVNLKSAIEILKQYKVAKEGFEPPTRGL